MIIFLLGMIVGGVIGVFIMCCMQINKERPAIKSQV